MPQILVHALLALLGLRRSRLRTALLLGAGAGAAGLVLFLLLRTPGFETIEEGRVYKSGELSGGELREVVEKYGLRSVIDLRTLGDLDPDDVGKENAIVEEGRLLEGLGVRYHHLPSPQVPTDEQVGRFLALMEDPANYPVLIHCVHGKGRSVLFSALYRIEFLGWDNERARQATRRFTTSGSSFDVDEPKGRFLESYVPRRHAASKEGQG